MSVHSSEPVLQMAPSELQVNHDDNITELYQAISKQNWDLAIEIVTRDPIQAASWVVRRNSNRSVLWRFLPVHSACARQPPLAVIEALLKAYPDGASCQDDQGMYCLHYAAGNQADREVLNLLIDYCKPVLHLMDPRGMLPLHYMACWGPHETANIDKLMTKKSIVAKDHDGNMAVDLARMATYSERDEVVRRLQKFAKEQPQTKKFSNRIATKTNNTKEPKHSKQQSRGRTMEPTLRSNEPEAREPPAEREPPGLFRNDTDVRSRYGGWEDNLSITEDQSHRTNNSNSDFLVDVEGAAKNQYMRALKLKDAKLKRLELENRRYQNKLEAKTSECEGLQESLGTLMEDYKGLQRKLEMTQNRLSSVSISLDSLRSQQHVVEQFLSNVHDIEKKRKELLSKLLESSTIECDAESLRNSLHSQSNELEAIVAIVNASERD